jgi:MipA family protein
MRNHLTVLIAAIAVSLTASAETRWGFGLAAQYGPEYPGSGKSSVSPSPLIERLSEDEVFYADLQTGPRIGLTEDSPVELGLAIDFRSGRDRADLDESLRGLGEVDLAIEVGGYVAWELESFLLRMDALTDVSDAHGGFIVTPAVEWYSDASQRSRINLGLGLDWTSKDYQRSYFGVSGAQTAATGLASFNASAGLSRAFIQAGLAFDLNRDWAISSVLGYSRWLGDAKDSPITRRGDGDFYNAEIGLIRFW